MRIARGLVVEGVKEGVVRVAACDWPWAAWTAAAALAPGVPLALWSIGTGHWIEFGGAAVFCVVGVASALLALGRRRDLEIASGRSGVSVRGRRGAWPLAAPVEEDVEGPVRIEIRPFATPAGAPELPDRGGDLVLVGRTSEILLSRLVGAGWRARLEAARDHVVAGVPTAA